MSLGLTGVATAIWNHSPHRHARLAMVQAARDTEAEQLESLFRSQAALGRFVAMIVSPQNERTEIGRPVVAMLEALAAETPLIWDIVVTDPTGRMLVETRQGAASSLTLADLPVIDSVPDRLPGERATRVRATLLRSSEAGGTPGLICIAVDLFDAANVLQRRVSVYSHGSDLPTLGLAIGRSWLIANDGAVIGQSAGEYSDAIAAVSHRWRMLREAVGPIGSMTLPMAGGEHLLLYRQLAGWPAGVLVDAGLSSTPLLQPREALALVLLVSAALTAVLALRASAREGRPPDQDLPTPTEVPDRLAIAADFTVDVVHEINNLLTVVAFDAEMVAATQPDDEALGVLSRSMLNAAARGAALTQSLLPLPPAESSPLAAIAEAGDPPGVLRTRNPQAPARVLLVDDSAAMRESISRRLRAEGFEVLEAPNVAVAETLIAQGVDVLVTDIVLDTATDGVTLAAWARATDPGLPIVFMSGYVTARQPYLLAGDDLASFVRKPFVGTELRAVIDGLLAVRESRRQAFFFEKKNQKTL